MHEARRWTLGCGPVRHEIEEADANLLSLIKDTRGAAKAAEPSDDPERRIFLEDRPTHESTGGFYASVPRTVPVNKTRDAQKPEAGQRRNIIRLVYLLCYLQ